MALLIVLNKNQDDTTKLKLKNNHNGTLFMVENQDDTTILNQMGWHYSSEQEPGWHYSSERITTMILQNSKNNWDGTSPWSRTGTTLWYWTKWDDTTVVIEQHGWHYSTEQEPGWHYSSERITTMILQNSKNNWDGTSSWSWTGMTLRYWTKWDDTTVVIE